MPAVIKELTGVRRHSLHGDSAAFRTGKGRSQQHQAPPSARISGCSIKLQRSEEHTSELQSLMRISYAVFCLKKKTTNNEKNMRRSLTRTSSTATIKTQTNKKTRKKNRHT